MPAGDVELLPIVATAGPPIDVPLTPDQDVLRGTSRTRSFGDFFKIGCVREDIDTHQKSGPSATVDYCWVDIPKCIDETPTSGDDREIVTPKTDYSFDGSEKWVLRRSPDDVYVVTIRGEPYPHFGLDPFRVSRKWWGFSGALALLSAFALPMWVFALLLQLLANRLLANQLRWVDGVVQANEIVITAAEARYRIANHPNYFTIGAHVIFKPQAESPQPYREDALDSVTVELGKLSTFAFNARIFNVVAPPVTKCVRLSSRRPR